MPVATPPLNPPAPNPPVREGILHACRRRPSQRRPRTGCARALGARRHHRPAPSLCPSGPDHPRGFKCHARDPRPRRGKSLQRASARLKPLHALGPHRPPRAVFEPSLVACARLACPSLERSGRARHGCAGPATARRPFCPAALVLRRASRARAHARNRKRRGGRADPCSRDRRRPTKRGCHVWRACIFLQARPTLKKDLNETDQLGARPRAHRRARGLRCHRHTGGMQGARCRTRYRNRQMS